VTSIWRNRDFVVLWAGRLVSTLGSGVSAIALPLLVLATTHSPAKAGIVSAVQGAPYFVLSVPAGVLVDTWNRRTILIVCDLGRSLVWTTVGVATLTHHVSLPLLVLAAACEGSFFVLHNIAMSASIPRVVTREQLPSAVAQNAVILGTSDLLGPAIGGAVFQLGRAIPFLADAASYFASIFSLMFVRTPLSAPRERERESTMTQAREGFSFVWSQPALRTLTLAGGTGDVLFAGIALALIVAAQRQAHASAATIGAIFAVASVAGLAGAVVAPRVVKRLDVGATFMLFGILGALVFPVITVARTAVGIGAVWAANVFLLDIGNVARDSFQLGITPDALRGRVNGLTELVSYGGLPIGTALAGFSLAALGPAKTLGIMAAGRIVLTIWLVATPSVRRASMGVDSDHPRSS
jgi:MFS family permease